ncbi:MAG: LysM peptidoglycan-binding domain-containing protein [Oscillospiraceae bacterium]|nr:LysM peptidoglycan-binding domain-containing protein [Oscillospiraceae bacterium]
MDIYIVQRGDTINSIARRYGVSVQRLISDNGLDRQGRIVPGQALIVLIPDQIYTVRPGDTLFSIAVRFGTTVDALVRNNPWLTYEQVLVPGRILTVSFTQKPASTARINGYAYPNISLTLLRRELPFLSTLTIFGYGFTDTGELIPPDDDILLFNAKSAGVAPILLLSSITENGNFSSERSSLLFNSPELQNTVLNSLAQVMQQKGYRGLDIDFEFVLPEDSQAFLGFVQNAVRIMHSYGFFVNVDLAPKSSDEQRGLLYEAHNYAALGAAADTVLLMTYEWGYTYGPPMAVAPIGPVTTIVDYALTQIPTDKIMLGIPNYGYDWTLPFEKGITRAESIGNEYAVSVAIRAGVPVEYDEASQAPWFNYINRDRDHVVWFEDVRSIGTKFDLLVRSGLRGMGYWNLMRPFSANWALVSVMFTPQKVY